MITLRRGRERFHTKLDWLDSWHTFSFGDHQDPRHMGFGALRVINDDRVRGGAGFATHGHRDMEIVTYVLEGELEHKDSMGNGSVIRPGDVQRMSAGTGVMHSEYNPQKGQSTHLLQIWLLPERRGIEPSYEQKHFEPSELKGALRLVASPEGRDGSVRVHQDAHVFAARLGEWDRVEHVLREGRRAWVHVARGAVALNDTVLEAGDGAGVQDESLLKLEGAAAGEILLFELG